jgi:cystathionine beta-synthase
VQVSDKETMLMTRRLVREEGIFAGGSSGAAVAGAIRYASERDLDDEKLVVVLLPDNGSRYLSKVFDDNWMRENQFLETDLAEATVGTVLERKSSSELVVAMSADQVGDVIRKLKDTDISQLPVVGEREQLLGIVTEVSLLNYLLRGQGADVSKVTIKDADVINSNVPTVTLNTPLESVMSVFSTNKVALVTDNVSGTVDRHVVGIITQIDLLDFLANR